MNKVKGLIWGIVLIAVGVILGGKLLGFFDVNLFFNGWWTLFIIIPSFIGIITDKEKVGHFVFFIIGVLLLLAFLNIINFEIMWKLLLPIVLVIIGLSIIFKNVFNKGINENIKDLNQKMNNNDGYAATFSGQDVKFDGEEFKGTNLNAVFGGIKLDLRKAIINNDVVINASAIFGGIDIYVPDGYKVKIKSNSIFGGVSENKKNSVEESSYTIFINATCMFGGVEIK